MTAKGAFSEFLDSGCNWLSLTQVVIGKRLDSGLHLI